MKTKRKKKSKKLPEAVGMWKDRWPKEMSSKEIARDIRKEQWKRD